MAEKKSQPERERRELSPWRPFGEDWPRLFEGRRGGVLDEFLRGWPTARAGGLVPAMDLADNDERYVVTVEVPGASKDDVHVELHENTLTIRGEKKDERKEENEQRRYVERCYGSFSRSVTLPADADADNLRASFKDGVLSVTIPKTERQKPRTIAIK